MNMPLVLLNRRRRGGSFSPYTLFSGTAIGTWFDPSDLSTMYQDAAGTTAVTTPGQPVGLRLDKSKGLALGAELAEGWLDSSTGWTFDAGWSLSSGSIIGGSGGNSTYASKPLTTVAGRWYRVDINVASLVGTLQFTIRQDAVLGATIVGRDIPNAVGSFSLYFLAATTTSVIRFGDFLTSVTIDNISVRELPGNHATQSVLASRPTYGIEPAGGRRNLLTFTEDFSNAAWVVSSATKTVGVADPSGGTSAATITATSAYGYVRQGVTSPAGTPTTINGLWVRRRTGTGAVTLYRPDAASGVNISSSISGSWSFVSLSGAAGASISYLRVELTVSGDAVDIAFPQLELGSTATAYQRVTTAFDVTEAGVQSCHYVQYDGSDDGMITNSIDFTATDKMSVFAGVRKLSDANAGIFAELSVNFAGSVGSFRIGAPNVSGSPQYVWGSRGLNIGNAEYTNAFVAAPVTNVLTGLGDISGDLATLRVNGTQVAQSTADQGTGNFGNYPLYIGRRNNATLPFNGKDYGIIVVGKATTADEITSTERWLSGKTGFYAPVITGVPTIGVS